MNWNFILTVFDNNGLLLPVQMLLWALAAAAAMRAFDAATCAWFNIKMGMRK